MTQEDSDFSPVSSVKEEETEHKEKLEKKGKVKEAGRSEAAK